MGGKRRRLRATWLVLCVREWRLDRNPLRRTYDRVETLVLAALVITFLAGAPFAVLLSGAWTSALAHRMQHEQEASRHQVRATVVTLDPGSASDYSGLNPQRDAQARWTTSSGKAVTGEVTVSSGTMVGSAVPVWVARDGQPGEPPLLNSQIAGQVVLAQVASVTVLAIVVTTAGLVSRQALDKRRMAGWESEWRANGPHWTTPRA